MTPFNAPKSSGAWTVERVRGTAADVHGRPLPEDFDRTVRLVDVSEPALVLGSTQPAVAERDVAVVRRRSGGGAVLVGPGEVVWVDVLVPASDRLWSQDVGVAFHWLGLAWTRALTSLGFAARWHEGPMVRSEWCREVCFAGIGPGEVTVEGKKVVGIAQRRVRAGSLFQCAALLHWDPLRMVDLVGLSPTAAGGLAPLAAPLDAGGAAVEAALLREFERLDG